LRQTRGDKKLPKTVFKTKLKTIETTCTLISIPCGFSPRPLKEGIFRVPEIFIEDYLRNLTCRENSKNRFGLSEKKPSVREKKFLKMVA
jgi:hypothetical protein